MKQIITLTLFCVSSLVANMVSAQDFIRITGKLVSKKDQSPVIYAHIYIPNTTYGTYSENDGSFELRAKVWNTFEITVSHIEHEITSLQINATEDRIDIGIVQIAPAAYALQEVVVTEDKNWKRNFDIFRRYFIGTTPNAKQCKIKNKLVLNFNYNERSGTMQAWAYEPLQIENPALGYHITYDLAIFELNFNTGSVIYKGFSFFEPMRHKNKRQLKRWEKNRSEAYHGSVMHFIRSLFNDELKSEGFEIDELVKINKDDGFIRVNGVTPQPADRQRIIAEDETPDALIFKSNNRLQVKYHKEKESAAYFAEMSNPLRQSSRANFQTSKIHLVSNFVHIYSDGYINDGTDMIVSGQFGWEKIADMLPLNYEEK